MAKKLFYKIGDACKAVDIQPYVLRYWETEFPFLNPSKSKSGQRVYSEHELDIIRRIKQLLYEEQYTTAGAKKKLEAELAEGRLGGNEAAVEAPANQAARPQKTAKQAATSKSTRAAAATDSASASTPGADPGEVERSEAVADPASEAALQTLRDGIEGALGQARELLASLDAEQPAN